MANLAAKDPAYSGPDAASRFRPGRSGNPSGRPSTAWLREELDAATDAHADVKRFADATGKQGVSIRKAMAARLLQIAFTDEAIVIGKDSDGELLKRVSSRESLEAIKILWAYALGKAPSDPEEMLLKLAEHLRSVARDQVEIGRGFLGKRLETMKDEEIAAFWRLCERDPQQFIVAAIGALAQANGEAPTPAQLPPPPAPESALPNPTGQEPSNDADSGGTYSQTDAEGGEG
jgi:hypothetical protein